MPACSNRYHLPAATALLLLGCCAFGWWQNTHSPLGGPISAAKVLWLFLALTFFFVVPFFLGRDPALPPDSRLVYRRFFYGFLLRAAVEAPMLLLTRAWRVEYGLTHNALMLALLLGSREALAQPSPARNFRPLLCAALFAESLNAWLFGQAARPQDGIYFAGDDPVFQRINTITWTEIAVLFPLLILWMWHYTTARIDGASRT